MSKKTKATKRKRSDNQARQVVLGLLQRSRDGLKLAEIAAAIGWPAPKARNLLRRMAKANEAHCTGLGQAARWQGVFVCAAPAAKPEPKPKPAAEPAPAAAHTSRFTVEQLEALRDVAYDAHSSLYRWLCSAASGADPDCDTDAELAAALGVPIEVVSTVRAREAAIHGALNVLIEISDR